MCTSSCLSSVRKRSSGSLELRVRAKEEARRRAHKRLQVSNPIRVFFF